MKSTTSLVLTVDAARARLFTRNEEPAPRGMPVLTELASLVHPEARVQESKRFSDSNPRSAPAGGGYGYQTFDDHREGHELEERRRFGRQIAELLAEHTPEVSRVVVCVTHTMRSHLADEFERKCPNARVTWVSSECSALSAPQLADMLHQNGHL